MADEARCTPLHPENMDATCSDVRELLAPTSFHVVHGGCASVLNVDKALIGQLSPLGKLSPTIGNTLYISIIDLRWRGDRLRGPTGRAQARAGSYMC